MSQNMQEELEKAYRQVWDYLEAGEWLNAMVAAGHLAGLDPVNKEYSILARHTRKITEIADKVKNSPKRGTAARLEEISRALPKLAETASFRSLTESVIESGKSSSRKKSIVISIIVAIIFVVAFDLVGYQYIQAQAIATESQRTSMEAWLGIQKLDKPVDILLLGDSACRADLAPGAFADRLGGEAINLGNTAQTSFLTDAWMLSTYVSTYGVPKAVVVTRTSVGYAVNHNIEFMANPPLPWGYWDDYGVSPAWKKGEIRQLFIEKYGVLYSDADILRERLLKVWDLFDYSINPRVPSHSYSAGHTQSKEAMDLSTRTPTFYFNKFYATPDTTNSIKFMADLARKHHFQLYFTLQCEWDEAVKAGLRTEHLAAEKKYLSQFTDDTYVHIVDQVPKTLFTREQMQSPNHLWHGSEQIYTEEIVNGIVAIQNSLTANETKHLNLTSVSLDKDSYQTGDRPAITVSVSNQDSSGIKGNISCLLKPSGTQDANWLVRAPAVSLDLNANQTKDISLQVTAQKLDKAGTYDLVVFLRQDVGNLSHETRIEIPKKIIVK